MTQDISKMETTQTAVEWLFQQILNGNITSEKTDCGYLVIINENCLEQAKAMEKQQMITAMIYTFNQQNTLPYGMEYLLNRDGMLEDCEDYYNETYYK
jgi:hypothetical protein